MKNNNEDGGRDDSSDVITEDDDESLLGLACETLEVFLESDSPWKLLSVRSEFDDSFFTFQRDCK